MGSKRRVVVDGKVKCSCCEEMKTVDSFFKSKDKGELCIESACKVCSTERKRLRKKPKAVKLTRDCDRCKEEKSIMEYLDRGRLCETCRNTPLPIKCVSKEQWTIKNKEYSEKLEKKYREAVEKELVDMFKKDSDNEIWAYIPNFNKKYQASSLGRIRCLPFVYRTPKGSLRKTEFYIVAEKENKGYLQTTLTDIKGKVHHKGTHRWVMYAFHGESELQVDHINGIRDDNRIENLRYVTARQNNNFRKDNIPEYFSSSLYGTYKLKDRWYSYISINGYEHFLGSYKIEMDAHNAYMKSWKEWDELGKLPEKWVNPDKTSVHDGIDFHNASKKWRVRVLNKGLYVGIFETENLALRVFNIVNYLIKRGVEIDKDLVRRIRKKYTTDNRFKYLVNIETGEDFHCIELAAKSLKMKPSTLHSKLNKNLVNDTPIRYK